MRYSARLVLVFLLIQVAAWLAGAEAAPAGGDRRPPRKGAVEAKPEWPDDGVPRHIIQFPPDAGHVDVKTQYGAKGDGVTDDSDALQKAFNENNDDHGRLIWFPPGTYVVSRKLVCMRNGQLWYGLQLIGCHRDKVIIKLKDNCPGFGDPAKPETMIQFSSRGSLWGNMAHWNSCWNMTLDTGTGNPGAIATNWYASNHGSMRDCTIRSGDGKGVCGVNMNGPWPGPCLMANTQIIGFDTGIAVGTREYGVTFRNVTLDRQRVVGLWNHSNMVACHRLRVRDCAGPAVQNLRREWVPGMLVLIDSELGGRGQQYPAIDNTESLVWLRNVKATGYSAVITGQGAEVNEYTNQKTQGLWDPPTIPINLPAMDPPDIPWDPPSEWAKGGNGDETQRAIDSGKTTVYIPNSESTIEKPIIIRGNVRRIIGMKTNYSNGKGLNGGPMWIYESTNAPALEFDFLTCGHLEHRSPKPLLLVTMRGCAYSSNAKGCGPLFIEDVCAGSWTFTNPINVWAWQWNPERDNYQVKATGGKFWVCGWKTEGNGTQFVLDGSILEILGGVIYPHNMKDGIPMFTLKDSAASLFVRTCSYGGKGSPDRVHDVKMIETRRGDTRQTETMGENIFLAYDNALLTKLLEGSPNLEDKAAAPKKSSAITTARKPAAASAEVTAVWDAKLYARVCEESAQHHGPRFVFSAFKREVTVESANEKGDVVLVADGSEIPWQWARLGAGEKALIAKSLKRGLNTEDAGVLGFWLYAAGQRAEGERELALASESDREAVRSAFTAPE